MVVRVWVNFGITIDRVSVMVVVVVCVPEGVIVTVLVTLPAGEVTVTLMGLELACCS